MVVCVNGERVDAGESFGVPLYPLVPLTEDFLIITSGPRAISIGICG